MNALEIARFITGVLSVCLAVRFDPWNWPIGGANAVRRIDEILARSG
jgi:hypothetical protein